MSHLVSLLKDSVLTLLPRVWFSRTGVEPDILHAELAPKRCWLHLTYRYIPLWIARFCIFPLGPVATGTVVSLITFQVCWRTFPLVPGLSSLPIMPVTSQVFWRTPPECMRGCPGPAAYIFLLFLLTPGYTGLPLLTCPSGLPEFFSLWGPFGPKYQFIQCSWMSSLCCPYCFGPEEGALWQNRSRKTVPWCRELLVPMALSFQSSS